MFSERITGNAAVARLEQFFGAFESSPPSAVLPVVLRRGRTRSHLASGGNRKRAAGIKPGQHHTLTNPHVVTPATASPIARRLNAVIAVNGDDTWPGCLAYQLRQSGLPYSLNDPANDSAKRLPTDRRVVSGFFHIPTIWNRSRQCLSETVREEIVA